MVVLFSNMLIMETGICAFVSDGVSARYKTSEKIKCTNEILKREKMARKVAKTGKFTIVDFLNLKNLELHTYPHNFLTNIIFSYFKNINLTSFIHIMNMI